MVCFSFLLTAEPSLRTKSLCHRQQRGFAFERRLSGSSLTSSQVKNLPKEYPSSATIIRWSVFFSFDSRTVASNQVVVSQATTRVRIPRSEIGKLACQAKIVGIFAMSEYPMFYFNQMNFFYSFKKGFFHPEPRSCFSFFL